ncbi:retrovirus-related pol polyprotein from transposon TNT 1-94 [Tanacetum coccineum]
MIVYTDHSALRHLFKKQDARPRLIRWILLLQDFDIKVKDKKCTENVTADHLSSRIDNDEISDDSDVDDNFPRETLMEINTNDTPWFADFANYLVGDVIPKGMTYQQKNKFFSDLKNYFWEDPYLFKEKENEHLLRAVVSQDIMSIVQNPTVVETSHLQTELERTKERFGNCIIKKENEYAQLGDLKGKSMDIQCASDTLDPLSEKLEDENLSLEFQLFNKVSEQKDTTNGKGVNIKFSNQSTSGTKLYSVTLLLKTRVPPKVVESNDLINPFKTSREENFVPINKARASVRKNLITVSQPHVITKNDVNSNSDGLSSTGVDNTAETRSPQPRSNTKNDRIPFMSKSSCIKNKEVEVEEHHRNLLISKNKKHQSSKCNNIKLAIRNDKSEFVCDMCCSKHMTGNLKLLINFVWKFLRTVHFRDDHIAIILGYGDLQWGNILFTRFYFVEGLGHNLFSVGNRTTNLYTIKLHEMAFASPICPMARATSTKSWLWHQRLSHLNFDTINELAKNNLVIGLLKFKYHIEHLCPSYEQGKSKNTPHPPKPIPNSKQRLHLLHMDLCGPMRVDSINGKRYVLVIVDDYSRYTWVYFLRSKDETPEVIKTFLKKIQNDREDIGKLGDKDIGKLGAKGDIGFFIGYSADSCAYRVYNRRTKKIMETMNVTFDELSAMAFEQSSSKPGLQSMTSGQLSSGLDLTYAPSIITS